MSKMKCQYCGKEFEVIDLRCAHYAETHDGPSGVTCPGSKRRMLKLTDEHFGPSDPLRILHGHE